MNILVVAPDSPFTRQVLAAFSAEGHQTAFIDDRQDYSLPAFLRPSRLLWRMSRRWSPLRARANRALQNEILARSVGMDALVALKGMNIRPATLETLRNRGVRSGVWCIDNGANEPYASWIREHAGDWSCFMSFDSAIHAQVPAGTQAVVVPLAVDPASWEVPLGDADRMRFSCDVCFVGAPYPERIALLSRIAETCDLRIWGWDGWKKTPLARYYQGSLGLADSAKAYRLAKIAVNTNVRPLAGGANLKTYEICAAGGFQLTDQPSSLGDSFAVGKELEVFASAEEFAAQVASWLMRDDERRRIAAAGQARVMRDHTLRARVRSIVTHLA